FAVIDRTNLTIDPDPTGKVNQGPAPVFLQYHPNVPLPDASNGYAVVPDPNLTAGPGQPAIQAPDVAPYDGLGVEVRIPAVSTVLAPSPPYPPGTTASVSGYYDGNLWTLTDGRLLPGGKPTDVPIVEVDIAGRRERMLVQLPPNAYDPT